MLELEDISLAFKGFSIREACLKVNPGEYLILFGPTGSGKTLLLEIIAGLRRPSGGRVSINGKDITLTDPAYRRIGYVPQDFALIPFKTVRQNVAFGLYSKTFMPGAGPVRLEIKHRVQETLSLLGIEHLADRLPANLSGGEKQRVALGRALAVRPEVLLLDEPLSALDENTGDALMKEIKAIQKRVNITTVHVCHRLDEVFFMGDRMAVIREGKIVQAGSPGDIYRNPADVFVAKLMRVRNIIAGEVKESNGKNVFFLGGRPVKPTALGEGKAHAVISSDSISLHSSKPEINLNNHISMECTVTAPQNWKPEAEIFLSGGFDFSLPAGAVPGSLRSGGSVYAAIPKSAVVVLGEGIPG